MKSIQEALIDFRMDYPEPEIDWRVQECYHNGGNGRLSWVLSKGLSLGKRVSVTGLVLCSAPLVLPPLLVVSAIGFVVSVPFGVFWASHACAEKLVSKLLPASMPSPLLLEHRKVTGDQEAVSGDKYEEKDLGFDIKEKKEEAREKRVRVGMITGLDENGSEKLEEEHASLESDYGQEFEKDEQGLVEETVKETENTILGDNGSEKRVSTECDYGEEVTEENEPGLRKETVDQSGNREDVGENDVERSVGDVEMKVEQAEDEPVMEKSKENQSKGLMYGTVINVIDGDEMNIDDQNEATEITAAIVEENSSNPREADVELEELGRETKGLIEKIRGEGRADELAEHGKRHLEEMHESAEQSVREAEMIPSKDESVSNTRNSEEEIVETALMGNIEGENQKSELEGEGGKTEADTAKDVEGSGTDGGVIILIPSDSNVRDIAAENDFGSYGDKNEDNHKHLDSTNDDLERPEQYPKYRGDEGVTSLEVPASSDMPQSADAGGLMDKDMITTIHRNEGKVEEPVVEESEEKVPAHLMYGSVINVIDGDETNIGDPNKTDVPVEVTASVVEESGNHPREADLELEELRRETRGLIEKIREEGKADELAKDGTKHVEEMHVGAEHGGQGIAGNFREAEMTSSEETSVSNTGKLEGDIIDTACVGEIEGEEQKPKAESEGSGTEDVIGNNVESSQTPGGRITAIPSDTEVKEIADETGLKLFDDKNDDTHGRLDEANDDFEGHEQHSSFVGEESVDRLKVPLSSDRPQSVKAESLTEKDMTAPNKAMGSGDEHVWERMKAIRMIVGYKAEPEATCTEELKALYVFTGVEPPASFSRPLDLVEINEKLQFLMSIVGVK